MGSLEIIKKLDQEIEAPADFTSPEKLYQELIAGIRKYHPSDDITMIEKAYRVAKEAHREQKRKSGEPYIIHPLCVAIILADLEMDKETIEAGLLHDVVEDTVMTDKELAQLTFAFRIFDHDVDISYSTRENPQFRANMMKLGVTSMSAGSKTDPGGYAAEPDSLEQFHVSDERSPKAVTSEIRALGYEPVWKDWDKIFD